MADAITKNLQVTYNGDYLVDIFLKPLLQTADYTQRFRVMPDVVGKKNIFFRGRAAKIMKKVTSCTFVEKGGLVITDKVIETTNVGVMIKECWNQFIDTIFEKQWLKKGTEKHDLTGTQVEQLFIEFMQEGIRRDIPRVLWFGDKTSPSEDFDWFDGWLKCMVADSAALGFALDISAFETGNKLNADAALDIMEDITEGAPNVMWQIPKTDLRWYVSRGIMHNYEASLRGTAQTDSAFNVIIDGVSRPAFNGIAMEVLPEWDEDLADADNPIKASLNTTSNNMVLLTTPQNLVVGIDGYNVMGNDARIWYSMDDDDIKARFNTMLGAQCFLEELFALAF